MDDYFDAKRWRPSAEELTNAVSKHLVRNREGYVVFPRYFSDAQTREIAQATHEMFHGAGCVRGHGHNGLGIGTVWVADAFSPAIDAFRTDRGLHAAAERLLNSTEQGANAVRDGFIEAWSIATHQDMDACAADRMAPEQRNALCGKKATSPANGFHVDMLLTATKALLYLTDVHKENGPFTMLRDYPVVTSKWGFTQPDPQALPVCTGEVEATGSHVLRYSTEHVISLVQRTRARPVEIHAPRGTVILFDNSNIHLGKSIVNASRTSVTNAYTIKHGTARRRFPGNSSTEHIHRSLFGFVAADTPAASAAAKALGEGSQLGCEQTSRWISFD